MEFSRSSNRYQAINEEEGMAALLRFTEKWGKQYPSCVKI